MCGYFAIIAASCAAEERPDSPADKLSTNSIGVEFVLIPAGKFTMGADSKTEESYPFEEHRHEVTITKNFYIGRYEVTQKQWEKVMGSNPSSFQHPDNPVENVTFEDVQAFIQRLNAMEKTTKYRLPTEAEWEYAARAGSKATYFFGNDESELEQYAWYEKNSEGRPHPVGQKKPNAWGLYDMLGNINEYVNDWFTEDYYSQSPAVDPTGPKSGTRLKRGGSWFGPPRHNRLAFRDGIGPTHSDKRGCRLVSDTE
jgi:formylglycine-generating enzyme required for sulfatase activity